MEDNKLVFTVVKVADGFSIPDDYLNKDDRRRLETIAANYLESYDLPSSPIRFETISIAVFSKERMLLMHHRNALKKKTDRRSAQTRAKWSSSNKSSRLIEEQRILAISGQNLKFPITKLDHNRVFSGFMSS